MNEQPQGISPDTQPLKGFPLSFQIYAHNEQEVEQCRQAIIGFINQHRQENRAVTATKVAQAITSWQSNPLIKTQIINYFK